LEASAPTLARKLGLADVTLIVMGGMIGSGIFVNPAVVALRAGSGGAAIAAWLLGGAIAMAGAFIYAELGARRPEAGGQYAYFREAFHPGLAFAYAWALLLLIQTGGMAASAMTFARYARELAHVPLPEGVLSACVLGLLTLVNALGVRAGAGTQNVLMLLKIVAILAIVAAGVALVHPAPASGFAGAVEPHDAPEPNFGAAMVPVLFAYGGWQTAAFLGGEVKDAARTLPRGMVLGVVGVVLLYVAVNVACLRALGAAGLAATPAPAAAIMRAAFGETGARLVAFGVAASTLGFLSQAMLTAPRVYYAMAADGLFFRTIARVDARTHVPVFAVVLQGAAAVLMALTGEYGKILDTVVAADWIFFGLTAACVFGLRRRDAAGGNGAPPGRPAIPRVPYHPFTTIAFIVASGWIVAQSLAHDPRNGAIGLALMLAAWPVYLLWRRAAGRRAAHPGGSSGR
jgi:APA family basic amino acid/polyamine antiporter